MVYRIIYNKIAIKNNNQKSSKKKMNADKWKMLNRNSDNITIRLCRSPTECIGKTVVFSLHRIKFNSETKDENGNKNENNNMKSVHSLTENGYESFMSFINRLVII